MSHYANLGIIFDQRLHPTQSEDQVGSGHLGGLLASVRRPDNDRLTWLRQRQGSDERLLFFDYGKTIFFGKLHLAS